MSPWTPTVLQCTTRRTPPRAAASTTSRATAVGVDRAVGVRRHARLPVDRGDVVDDVDARGRGGRARARRAGRRRPASMPARARSAAGSARDRARAPTPWPARHERAREVAAGKPGRAGYEDAHRSATSVTGEPNGAAGRRARASLRTTIVKRRDPIALCSAIGRTNWRCTERMRKPLRSNASAIVRVGEHAIRLGPHAHRVRRRRRAIDCEQRDAARRRIVDDDQPLGDAAQLGDRTAASRGVCISTAG